MDLLGADGQLLINPLKYSAVTFISNGPDRGCDILNDAAGLASCIKEVEIKGGQKMKKTVRHECTFIGLKPLSGNETCVDLSRKGLQHFPLKLFPCPKNIQLLYLQGNILEELPDSFFKAFSSLSRLDLRDNQLHTLPESIGNHQCLEVILLQNNKITTLPTQLGLVPRLRGLQLTGNPLQWPPQNIISGGLDTILSFLRTNFDQPKTFQSTGDYGQGDHKEVRSKDDRKSDDEGDNRTHYTDTCKLLMDSCELNGNPTEVAHVGENCKAVLNSNQEVLKDAHEQQMTRQKKQHKIVQASITNPKPCTRSNKAHTRHNIRETKQLASGSIAMLGIQDDFQKPNHGQSNKMKIQKQIMKKYISPEYALAVIRGKPFPLGYRKRAPRCAASKAYKALLYQIWTHQLKCVLQAQEHVLQARRDKEVLQTWHQETRQLQTMAPLCKWKRLNPPFDFACGDNTTLTRSELLQLQNKSMEKRGHAKPNAMCQKAPGLYEKVVQLLAELNKMQLSKASIINKRAMTHSGHCKELAMEMKKVQDLQRAVQAIRLGI